MNNVQKVWIIGIVIIAFALLTNEITIIEEILGTIGIFLCAVMFVREIHNE